MCGIDSIAMFYKTLLRVKNGLQWNIDVTFKDNRNTTISKVGTNSIQMMKNILLIILRYGPMSIT